MNKFTNAQQVGDIVHFKNDIPENFRKILAIIHSTLYLSHTDDYNNPDIFCHKTDCILKELKLEIYNIYNLY